MAWPLSQDYNEAIQSPRTCFSDPELQAGEPLTNALGLPRPRSGNFADVYEVDCPATQSRWAVKCFTREIRGLRERYAEISRHLQQAKLPFGVEFHYLEQGIRAHSSWYPVVKMRWIEGLLLNEFVRDSLDKPARLTALSQIWTRLAKRLREANVVHADLQHGNVILVPGSTAGSLAIKLIDYDGMWVPALANRPSGELGHPNYQHPQRLRERIYSPDVDRFGLLVVATALRALIAHGQALWDRYDNGDNLLFKESDFRAPEESALFRELSQSSDAETRALVGRLQQAIALPLDQCPLLEEPEPAKAAPPPPPQRVRSDPPVARPVRERETPLEDSDEEARAPRRRRATASRAPLIAGGVAGALVLACVVVGGIVWATRKPAEKQRPPLAGGDGGIVTKKDDKGKGKDAEPKRIQEKDPQPALPDKVGELRRFEGGPTGVAFSPDGRTAAYVNKAHAIVLWNLAENAEAGQLPGHENVVRALRFSHDGQRLLSGSDDGTARLWDHKNGKELRSYPGHKKGAKAVAWRGDDRSFVTFSGERELVAWVPSSDQALLRTTVPLGHFGMALSPSGSRLLLGGDNAVDYVWDVEKEQELTKFSTHPGWHSYGLAFSADGRKAIAGGGDRVIRLLDVDASKVLKELRGHEAEVYSLAVSADGKRAISGSIDGSVRLWDLDAGKEAACLEGHVKPVQAVAFSPNGRFALTAGEDDAVILWGLPVPGGEALAGLRPGRKAKPVEVERDERRYEGHSGEVWAVAFSPDGKRMVTGGKDKTARIWDRESGKTLHVLSGHEGGVTGASFSPDGKWVATCSDDKTIRLWDAEAGKQTGSCLGHTNVLKNVAFSPDGRKLLSAADDNTVRLWDVQTSAELRRFDLPSWARRAAFSPDGRYAVASCEDGHVRVWSLANGKEFRKFAGRGDLYSCAFLADGQRVAAGSFDKVLRVWDVVSGQLMQELSQPGRIWAVAASPDPRHLLTAGEDGVVRLWDVKRGREMTTYPFNCRHDLAFSPDGTRALCGTLDGTVRVWKLPVENVSPVKPGSNKEPDAESLKKAEEVVRERFKAEFAIKGVAAGQALSAKLLEEGRGTTNDHALRVAYLRAARDRAAQVGDLVQARRAHDDLAFLGGDNEAVGLLKMLQTADKSSLPDRANLAVAALEVADMAVLADDYESATKAVSLSQKAAQTAKNEVLQTVAKRASSRVTALSKEYDAVTPDLKTLADDPKNAAANLAVGKFQCFRKEDWSKGLPLLAAGEGDLSAVAKKDQAAKTPAALAEVGHAWWDLAAKETGQVQTAIRRRARGQFYQALPALGNLERAKVEDRLKLTFGKTTLKPGLVAELFTDGELKKRVKTRIDYQVEFNWGLGSPDAAVPADNFSVRWQGWLVAPSKGKYTLYVHADDGARVSLAGKLVIDGWTKPGKHSCEVDLDSKPRHVVVEFHEGAGTAMMVLGWTPPGGKEGAVPPEALFHDLTQEKLLAK
jgi:WD40 repeat protein